jgi:cysteine desulfurase
MEIAPLIAGGGQERGLRSGTENVPAIVGFGIACELAVAGLAEAAGRMAMLRGLVEQGVLALGAEVFSRAAKRLPNTVFFALPELDGETLVGRLDRAGYAVASGSACSSANPEPSATLLAMGVDREVARGAVRVSLGRDTRQQDVHGFLAALQETVRELRQLAAMAV